MAIWWSMRGRHDVERRSQSLAVGVRFSGSEASAVADLVEAQADLLGDADERDAAQRVTGVPPLAAPAPRRVDEALGLVEAQRRRRHAAALAHRADGQLRLHDLEEYCRKSLTSSELELVR